MQTRFVCAFTLLTIAALASATSFRDDSHYVARGPRTGYYIVRPGSVLIQQLGLQGAPWRDTSDPLNRGRGADVLAFRLNTAGVLLQHRLTSCRGRLTSFTSSASVLSSAGAPARMMSKASLGVRSRLKSGATASSPIIRSRFTIHSKKLPVGDASHAHAHWTNPNNTKRLVTF